MANVRKMLAAVVAVWMVVGMCSVGLADITILHSFTGSTTDGDRPRAAILTDGTSIYGTTRFGGASAEGVVYKMDMDGGNFTLLHSFAGGGAGENPFGGLTLVGSNLYGTTYHGGSAANLGTIFRIGTDGTGFWTMRQLQAGEPRFPGHRMIADGNNLYGSTYYGGTGTANRGCVYKYSTGGGAVTVLKSFGLGADDEKRGTGFVAFDADYVYGTASEGGGAGKKGVIYRVGKTGANYSVLHAFAGGTTDGDTPVGLILGGSTIYGTANSGGAHDNGVVYKMAKDGTGFDILHSFAADDSQGSSIKQLLLSGTTLYGLTSYGGTNSKGVVFQINTDGTDFALLHEFAGGSDDGQTPYNDAFLTLHGNKLYGTTLYGGSDAKGVVFSIPIPEPATLCLLALGGIGILVRRRRRS